MSAAGNPVRGGGILVAVGHASATRLACRRGQAGVQGCVAGQNEA
jgi:hypothetical protein